MSDFTGFPDGDEAPAKIVIFREFLVNLIRLRYGSESVEWNNYKVGICPRTKEKKWDGTLFSENSVQKL